MFFTCFTFLQQPKQNWKFSALCTSDLGTVQNSDCVEGSELETSMEALVQRAKFREAKHKCEANSCRNSLNWAQGHDRFMSLKSAGSKQS